jgi:sugar/nucleoside kinase (ribokinase family)
VTDVPADAGDDDRTHDLLFGAVSLDHYRDGTVLPGGGVLNMAWHWRRLRLPFTLLTRIGGDDGDPVLRFLDRHGIAYVPDSIVAHGRTATIDVEILPDRQPHMDHFVEGVWGDTRSTPTELGLLCRPGRLHAVLVEGAIAELERLAGVGALADRIVSADFLGFRHYTVERFARTIRTIDVGFVGWPGETSDPTVEALADVARDAGRRLIVTFGSRGVRVVDGRDATPDRWVPVEPVQVQGTTVGCGDAFIAWFLAEYWSSGDLEAAVAHGMKGGTLATGWVRPLPDDAY